MLHTTSAPRRALLILTVVVTLLTVASCSGTGGQDGDYARSGPHKVSTMSSWGTTIYYPADIGTLAPRPVILWGNGIFTVNLIYEGLLRHYASRGFVVAAATSSVVAGPDLIRSLDDVTARSRDASSPLFGKVDLDRVGATGHSLGGIAALSASATDARVKTAFPMAGTVSTWGVKGPTLLMAGQLDFVIPAVQVKFGYSFLGAGVPGAYVEVAGATHIHATGNGGTFRGIATAWAEWHLMGDLSAKALFVGPGCGLCNDNRLSSYESNGSLS
jgi:predicted dienelactone hydrolase